MLTTGKIIFAIVFVFIFIVGMFYAYRKDSAYNRIHFGGSSKIIALIVVIIAALFLFVKLRHYL